jgi:uncharacterized RDD family membrane protein YckC
MFPDLAKASRASFLQRAAAYLIDSAVLLGAWFVAFMCAGAALTGMEDESSESDLVALFIIVFGPATWFLYQWACNAHGTSIGKKVMRLAILPLPAPGRLQQRRQLGTGNGFKRTIGQALGVLALGLGFWSALWDPERRAWHDRMAGTPLWRRAKKALVTCGHSGRGSCARRRARKFSGPSRMPLQRRYLPGLPTCHLKSAWAAGGWWPCSFFMLSSRSIFSFWRGLSAGTGDSSHYSGEYSFCRWQQPGPSSSGSRRGSPYQRKVSAWSD